MQNLTVLKVILPLWTLSACGGEKPEQAYQRLEAAIAHDDVREFFGCLDGETRSTVELVFGSERQQRELVTKRFNSLEAERALPRLEAAQANDSVDYFSRRARRDQLLEQLRRRIGAAQGEIEVTRDGEHAVFVGRKGSKPFHFVRRDNRFWLDELLAGFVQEKERAAYALKSMRSSANSLADGATP